MTATSVSITVATLQELGHLKSFLGTTIVSAAVIDDVIGIVVPVSYTHLDVYKRQGLTGGQLEHGRGGKGTLFFQAVQQDQDNGVDPQQTKQGLSLIHI